MFSLAPTKATLVLFWVECREALKGAGEIGFPDSWWQMLVVSEEEEIGTDGADGSDEILMSPKENAGVGKGLLDVFAAYAFRFLWQRTFHVLDSSIPRHKHKKFAASRGFSQKKHVPRMEAIEGAANEDAFHFFWRSTMYTLFSSRR